MPGPLPGRVRRHCVPAQSLRPETNMIVQTTSASPASQVPEGLAEERPIGIPSGGDYLTGSVSIPPHPVAVVLVLNDAGSSRQRAGERELARALRRAGFATVLADVLTPPEQAWPDLAAGLRQDVELLAKRIESARDWIRGQVQLAGLPVALVGAGGAGPACLVAAAARPEELAAVVVRSPRPDLAGMALGRIKTPVMLCIAQGQPAALAPNDAAFALLRGDRRMLCVPGRSVDASQGRAQLAAAIVALVRTCLDVREAA